MDLSTYLNANSSAQSLVFPDAHRQDFQKHSIIYGTTEMLPEVIMIPGSPQYSIQTTEGFQNSRSASARKNMLDRKQKKFRMSKDTHKVHMVMSYFLSVIHTC